MKRLLAVAAVACLFVALAPQAAKAEKPSLGKIVSDASLMFLDDKAAWQYGNDPLHGWVDADSGAAYAAAQPGIEQASQVNFGLDPQGLFPVPPVPGGTTKVNAVKLQLAAAYGPGDELWVYQSKNGVVTNATKVFAAGALVGTTANINIENPFGFYVHNVNSSFGNLYTENSRNPVALGSDYNGVAYQQHFQMYAGNLGTYAFGLEDLGKSNSDRDFNDYVFTATFEQVPEPAFIQLGTLIAGAGLLFWRRRRAA